MDELLNEHEQGERVRSWLQRNAIGLLGGIGLGLALIYGWQWWQGRQAAQSQAVAGDYDRFQQALVTGPEQASKLASGKLAATPYGTIAALELAKAQVDAGKEAEALATLKAVKTDDAALAPVLRQRIGELLIATGKPAEAITLLAKATDAGALEVIGDAHAQLGKTAEAGESYRKALRTLEEGSPERQVVELKLADVGGQADS